MTSLGVFAFFLTFSMPSVKSRFHHRPWWDYNWKRVVLAELPVLLIAVGAGITIPFMNLFFHEQFQIPPATFSLIGGGAGFLVLLGNLLIPKVHSKWGYKKTLLWTQGSGIVLLILLGFTDLYAHTGNLALQLSILFYLLRQPLMNIATPITNDLIVKVVGEKNQELVSGFNSLIWSGSWVFGSFFFGFLRSLHFPYRTVFWLTSVLYLLGLTAYLFLIQRLEKEISSSSK
jgi:predicted MFS family arabinose efflux permease